MATVFIAFIFTALIFAFFLYYYVWQNRHSTQIRMAITKIDGRVISIERIVRETKKIRADDRPNLFALQSLEWKVIYKDKEENFCEAVCRLKSGQLEWHPPLS